MEEVDPNMKFIISLSFGIPFLFSSFFCWAEDLNKCDDVLVAPSVNEYLIGPIQGPSGDSFLLETFIIQNIPIVLLKYLNPSFILSEDKRIQIESLIKKGSHRLLWEDISSRTQEHRVNCHGFALMHSNIEFVASGYWVNSLISNTYTFGFNPFLEILKMYFTPVVDTYISPIDLLNSDNLNLKIQNLKPGDILVFIDENQNIIHSGVLVVSPVDSLSLQLLHKLGPGPVLLSPLNHVQDIYRFSNIAVWRKST
jgi:hypothetical protein